MAVRIDNEQSLIEGIKRYAQFDQSDPFTFARCMCHLRAGICRRDLHENGESVDSYYDAEVLSEVRDGKVGITFKNVVRP